MSKRTRERDVASGLIDSEFEQALEETEHRHGSRSRRMEQKTHQLCRQVQRALNLALAADGALDDVFVVGVSAAGGCRRLVAHVEVPDGRPIGATLEELRDRSSRLRAIVAGYISRKRAPELIFVVAPPGSDAHD